MQPRDAATVILLRGDRQNPAVLMGQRPPHAAFMAGKFVFPGGAVEAGDQHLPLVPLRAADHAALLHDSAASPAALAAAAIRETYEETGQIIGASAPWPSPPPANWASFAARGYRPDASQLQFFFRAITPPGQTRRFDARFFIAPASALASNLDDFSAADDELRALHWVPLSQTGKLDLPRITAIVLDHLRQTITHGPQGAIPCLRRDDPGEIAPIFRV